MAVNTYVGITSLVTCQTLASKAIREVHPRTVGCYNNHLVRSRDVGTPGPMLCGVERFGFDAPGWDLRGGAFGPNTVQHRCVACTEVAFREYPGLPIHGHKEIVDMFTGAISALAEMPSEAASVASR